MRDALASGSDIIFRVDQQGAQRVKAALRPLKQRVASVFITAESEAQLVQRLEARGTEDAVRFL